MPGTALTDLIAGFEGDHRWPSNFAATPLSWDGRWYPTAEAAFHAGKTLNEQLRADIAAAGTPAQAKALGRGLDLRPDWTAFWRHAVMREVLAAKFADPVLAGRLVGTGTALLVETNLWCDLACARSVSDQRGTRGRS
jgi:predicted NAD-dependent protein-ADP-ribosyltransferase YbiA (DUF1768 family)